MEDTLSGRRPQWKTTSVEDDLSGRQPQWKTTSVEDDLSRRRPQWKTTSVEDDLSRRQPQWKTTLLVQNQQNLLCNICRSTLVESQTILKRWKTPPWKTTLAQSQQASQLEPELGIAQPQLVFMIHLNHFSLILSKKQECTYVCIQNNVSKQNDKCPEKMSDVKCLVRCCVRCHSDVMSDVMFDVLSYVM